MVKDFGGRALLLGKGVHARRRVPLLVQDQQLGPGPALAVEQPEAWAPAVIETKRGPHLATLVHNANFLGLDDLGEGTGGWR